MENKEKEQSKKRDFLLPGSILIAALLVSISLVYNAGKKNNDNLTADIAGDANQNKPKSANIIIKPVGDTDHVYGNPSAPVKIVEFSDLECPWCKNFHSVLKQTVAAYGGKVAWVYRHFPIDQLHPKARKEAEASECANELGGNDKFWSYIDRLFEITPSNNGLDANLLPQIAADIGLNKNEFEKCLASGKYATLVAEGVKEAKSAGARGTPYAVVIAEDGRKFVIPGALPFDDTDPSQPTVKSIVDQAFKK